MATRKKELFNHPVLKRHESELNFVANNERATRTLGNSVETLGRYDLVPIGNDLGRIWENGSCRTEKLYEVTIQFMPEVQKDMLHKNVFDSIRNMFAKPKRGIAFELPATMQVYALIDEITNMLPEFLRMHRFLGNPSRLGLPEDYHELSSTSLASFDDYSDNRRILKAKEFITQNYKKGIRLQQFSDLAGMLPTEFSRLFRKHTSRNAFGYNIFMRLGYAAHMLADSSMSVVEVCYACGGNNVSNFNRIFKKRKGCMPKEFHEEYL